jgi:1-acyl-sn-glycerol-3-phosphate acyltransferase
VQPAVHHVRARPPRLRRIGAPDDLLAAAGDALTPLERFHVRLVRKTIEPGPVDRAMRFLQREVGARWINASTSHIRHIHGVERLPRLDPAQSFLCVSNHRSFFDLYVITALLVGGALDGVPELPHRLLFPVRSNFFYDNPLGIVVNGAMSFFAMYPPVFRPQSRSRGGAPRAPQACAALNIASLDETARVLRKGGAFVGVHPEGTRKKDDDPYTFLPAQSGVGRLIHRAKVPVLPVFVNGLVNSIPEQIFGNVTRKGKHVFVVFGAPVDFGPTLAAAPSPRVYKTLSENALDAIGELAKEERELRAKLGV